MMIQGLGGFYPLKKGLSSLYYLRNTSNTCYCLLVIITGSEFRVKIST